MDIFNELQRMQERIHAKQWSTLEVHYHDLCEAADAKIARRIAETELNDYNDRQFDAYCKALKKAKKANAPVIYFEYDLNNDWQSSFFVCNQYVELAAHDDDWACEWTAAVRGSCIPKFANIYEATDHFCMTPAATAITLYLIARTTAALQTVVARKPVGSIKVCLGFHDQDPIHRLHQ